MSRLIRSRVQQVQAQYSKAWNHYQRGDCARSYRALYRLLQSYESLTAVLYQVRSQLSKQDPVRQRVEDFVAHASFDVGALQESKPSRSNYAGWLSGYRKIWKENLALFLLTLGVFVFSIAFGWLVGTQYPDYVTSIVGQSMVEKILDREAWFESIQMSPLFYGYQIAVNNLKVAIHCFAMGCLFGLGGMLVLGYNGLLFGAIMGFCFRNGFHEQLSLFVIGHGPLELSIIVASAFCSFLFGRVFFMRPWSALRMRMAIAGRQAGIVLTGIVPWLVLAAIIEVGVSPWPFYSAGTKLSIGILMAAFFFVWTFWPSPRSLNSN